MEENYGGATQRAGTLKVSDTYKASSIVSNAHQRCAFTQMNPHFH